MVVDATVPMLISLAVVVVAVVLAAVTRRVLERRARRPAPARRVGAALRCPKIVLIDEIGSGHTGLAAAA